jgi:hypothetical protein
VVAGVHARTEPPLVLSSSKNEIEAGWGNCAKNQNWITGMRLLSGFHCNVIAASELLF